MFERKYFGIRLYFNSHFNAVIDPDLDKKLTKGKKQKIKCVKLPKSFFKLTDSMHLLDVWRLKNPSKKQYTFYSVPHNLHSRLDMIWSTADLVLEMKEVDIHPRLIADHNPIQWEINTKSRKRFWKLNNVYWQDKSFKNQIMKEMKEFYEINMN